jgi:hypothetical protein
MCWCSGTASTDACRRHRCDPGSRGCCCGVGAAADDQILCLAEQVYFTRQVEEVLKGDASSRTGLLSLKDRLTDQLNSYTSHDLSSEPLLQVCPQLPCARVVGGVRVRVCVLGFLECVCVCLWVYLPTHRVSLCACTHS